MKRLLTITGSCMLLLTACSKDKTTTPDNNNPAPTPTVNTVIDPASLIGKWEATSYYIINYDSTGAIKDQYGASQTYKGGTVSWADALTTFMTFDAGNTYKHEDKNGNPKGKLFENSFPVNGSWSLKNSNKTITLQMFKTFAGDSLFNYDVVEFKNTYMHLIMVDTYFSKKEKFIYHLEFKK